MNMNLADEVARTLKRTRNAGTNRKQKEVYLQMASKMRQELDAMDELRRATRNIANQ